jgi:hypothetical protein
MRQYLACCSSRRTPVRTCLRTRLAPCSVDSRLLACPPARRSRLFALCTRRPSPTVVNFEWQPLGAADAPRTDGVGHGLADSACGFRESALRGHGSAAQNQRRALQPPCARRLTRASTPNLPTRSWGRRFDRHYGTCSALEPGRSAVNPRSFQRTPRTVPSQKAAPCGPTPPKESASPKVRHHKGES